mmetsp:Transcript_39932/g.59525  ORF Transcript_39932/g.59525 Transcript_39932/m.59525 type:complete len:157 (+) Transcript_39932:1-471(+)
MGAQVLHYLGIRGFDQYHVQWQKPFKRGARSSLGAEALARRYAIDAILQANIMREGALLLKKECGIVYGLDYGSLPGKARFLLRVWFTAFKASAPDAGTVKRREYHQDVDVWLQASCPHPESPPDASNQAPDGDDNIWKAESVSIWRNREQDGGLR